MSSGGGSAEVGEPMVVAERLNKSFTFGEVRTEVLRDLSVTVATGAMEAIVGPSGSGKTTLLSLLGGLDRVDTGRLVVAGHQLDRASSTELAAFRRGCVGFIFQFYNLLATLTARENVELGLQFVPLDAGGRRQRALDYLSRVDLQNMAHKFPAQLSGGEQQRVAVARALAPQPKLILADEPTGNLDGKSGELVWDLLRDLQQHQGATCVIVTHDLELAGRTDRVIQLSDGQVVENA